MNKYNDLNNVNRLLNGVKSGLTHANRKYILKTRTDILFNNDSFLDFFGKYCEKIMYPQKDRLIITNYYTRNAWMFPITYSPSDWILFGHNEDVKRFYNSPLMGDVDKTFLTDNNIKTYGDMYPRWMCEQYIFTSYLTRINHKVLSKHTADNNVDAIMDTEKMFAKCFVVLDYGKDIGIEWMKRNPKIESFSLYGRREWIILYNYYCGNKNVISLFLYHLLRGYSKMVGKIIKIRRNINNS